MVRYRRRGYRKATNAICMKFQSFMDISTDVDSMKIITISAGGENVLKRLPAQFSAYKFYRLGNVAVKLVPASTLPVDPTGLSIDPNKENLVDPRDQLTPGMMRITNGQDVFEQIQGLTPEVQDEIYNQMLLDPRWFKWMLQTGVKRHGTPRYWQIGQFHQDKWPGQYMNYPLAIDNTPEGIVFDGTQIAYKNIIDDATTPGKQINEGVSGLLGSSSRGIFQVGQSGRLGWLPTDGMNPAGNAGVKPMFASPPTVELFKIILPRARKTRYWYRMFITETVLFKEPIVMSTDYLGYRPLDIFHTTNIGTPKLPTERADPLVDINDSMTGGNYGGNSGI